MQKSITTVRQKKQKSWPWWHPKKFAKNQLKEQATASSVSGDNENDSAGDDAGATMNNPYTDVSFSMRVLKSTKSEKSYDIASTASIISKSWVNHFGSDDAAESVSLDEQEDLVGSWLETNKPSQSSTSLPMPPSQKAKSAASIPARRSCEHIPISRTQTWQQRIKVWAFKV